MNNKRLVPCILSLLLTLSALGQIEYDSTLLKLLFADTSTYKRWFAMSPLIWDGKVKQVGNILKHRNKLYFLPDQYGAVFLAEKTTDSITVSRLDRTIYSGYNGAHYCFIHDNKLYSFGGYGMWRTNGHLRVFLEDKGEWEIVKLDAHVPTFNEFTYFDPASGNLWCAKQDDVNEVFPSNKYVTTYRMRRMKMGTGHWEDLGEVSYPQTYKDYESRICSETPYGPLVFASGPSFVVYDFAGNRKIGLGKIGDSLRQYLSLDLRNHSIYSINNTLVWYHNTEHRISKSFTLQAQDLHPLSETVYQKPLKWGWIAAGIGAFLLAGMAIWRVRSVKELASPGSQENEQKQFHEMLSDQERAVFLYLKEMTLSGAKVSTDDLNRFLGTQGKGSTVQRRHRSDVIKGINTRFKTYFRTNDTAIQVSDSSIDARMKEYSLKSEALEALTRLENA